MDFFSNKVYSVLKSLFRYSKLKALQAPKILFQNEEAMLSKRIRDLSPEEVYIVVTSWEEFKKQQSIQDEIQDKQLDDDIARYNQSIN